MPYMIFNIKAIEMGAENVWSFATAAVRNAENGDVFTARVKEKVLLDVDVLSKKREAQMGFIGVGGEGMRGILDIGGGSTEIAVGDGETISRCSMDLGRRDRHGDVSVGGHSRRTYP